MLVVGDMDISKLGGNRSLTGAEEAHNRNSWGGELTGRSPLAPG
jgi:hypothetical protein